MTRKTKPAAPSQGNAFTLPSGLSWDKEEANRRTSTRATARVEKAHEMGIDVGAIPGMSRKSDENLRVRAEQHRARARAKK